VILALGLGGSTLIASGAAPPPAPAPPSPPPAPAALAPPPEPVLSEVDRAALERAYRARLERERAERALAVDRTPPTSIVLAARAEGWGWLVDRLAADGIPRDRAARAFADPRVPGFDGLSFAPNPREPHARYHHFLRAQSVARARRCAALHAEALGAAQRTHGVAASVVAAILHVETACGANTGRSLVLHRLARLAMANEPHNVARNLARWSGPSGRIDPALGEQIRARARTLEGIFYPQVVATFEIAAQHRIDPLEIRGSSAGAFGYPQFLPLNYIAFGTDGNGDGIVSLYDAEDAVASAARFLASHGWRPGLPRVEQREVIAHYNRSEPYIDTVLALAERIDTSGALHAASGAATVGALEATPGMMPASAPASSPAPATLHP
jgi:membrane-bound lytic murein transglycosylase B